LIAFALIGKRLTSFRDSYPVIGELEMRAGKLDLGHVTGDAQTLSDRAGFVVAAILFFSPGNRS
jgi:hypothetical protein